MLVWLNINNRLPNSTNCYRHLFKSIAPNKTLCLLPIKQAVGALYVWTGVVETGNNGSVYYGRSFYNIPLVYTELEDYQVVENGLKQVLASNLND